MNSIPSRLLEDSRNRTRAAAPIWPRAALALALVLAWTLLEAGCSRNYSSICDLSLIPGETKTMSRPQPGGNIEHVQADNFEAAVLRSEAPVLVDFYADWCGPCRALGPTLEAFARNNPGTKVVKVNVDDDPELAERYEVSSIPCLLAFRDNRVVGRQVGMTSEKSLEEMFTR